MVQGLWRQTAPCCRDTVGPSSSGATEVFTQGPQPLYRHDIGRGEQGVVTEIQPGQAGQFCKLGCQKVELIVAEIQLHQVHQLPDLRRQGGQLIGTEVQPEQVAQVADAGR